MGIEIPEGAMVGPIELAGNRILVTGAFGFLGRHLLRALRKKFGNNASYVPWPHGLNLMDPYALATGFHQTQPDYVFHLAGHNGGIAFNERFPADIFMRNTVMGCYLMDIAAKAKVKKIVSVVASCAYPQMESVDWGCAGAFQYQERKMFCEEDFLDGPPHNTVACHGYAKRNLQLASRYYHAQYGLNAVCVCPATIYGPGDSFDPERTKVVGALVKKFCDAARAEQDEVVLWGSGTPLREFLYVEDAASLLIKSMENYDDSNIPLNLGTGQEYTINDLAELIAEKAKYAGKIRWDKSKPDGQHRKRLTLDRMREYLGDFVSMSLDVGIGRTIEDYRARSSK